MSGTDSPADTTATDVLLDGLDRLRTSVPEVVDGLDPDQLAWRPYGTGNPVGWLVWHLLRVVDDHLADLAGEPQAWTDGGFAARAGLDLDDADTGYGHDDDRVGRVRVEADLLAGYARAVLDDAERRVRGLDARDLARVVDEGWDPPVTAAVRLVSVLEDARAHVGQAQYVRGLLPGD